jgi:short-subunit dehydrogenase
MKLSSNMVAVVTGAAGGIGRATAEALARRGCDLALVDIDEAALREAGDTIKRTGRRVSIHVVDVADAEAMERLPDAVVKQRGGLHLLVNNAGVSLSGPLESYALDDLRWIVGVNLWGVVHGCKLFLPHLRQQSRAHIVNICSDFGLLGFPTKTAYCTTKFAIRGFTESLRAELYGTNVGVTSVYPGPVDTALVRAKRAVDPGKRDLEAEFVASRGLSVERVAERIIRGIERNTPRVLIGLDARAIDLVTRLFPVLANTLVGRYQRRIPFV